MLLCTRTSIENVTLKRNSKKSTISVNQIASLDMHTTVFSSKFLFVFQVLSDDSSTTNSISQAKSRIGHVMVMLLQVGVKEKFKNVPLSTGLNLACFAGALLFSSASLFLLSRLHCSPEEGVTVGHSSHNAPLERNTSDQKRRHDSFIKEIIPKCNKIALIVTFTIHCTFVSHVECQNNHKGQP